MSAPPPPAPEALRAVALLRDHLAAVDFVAMHRHLVGPELYGVNPNLIRRRQRAALAATDAWIRGADGDLRLALCLLADVPITLDALPAAHRPVAAALLEARLMVREPSGQLRMGPLQLLSFRDVPLLADRRLNFDDGMHAVYLGPDSLLLTQAVDVDALGPGTRALDLGTGTGALGLYLARFADETVLTDIETAPLWLSQLNRTLAGLDARVTIRAEDFVTTLGRGERYDAVTFNPPFIAIPDGLAAPRFARGIGHDGLDWCRMVIELFDEYVTPAGTLYLVADMLGDDQAPFFLDDLHGYATALALAFDVYLEARVDLRGVPAQLDVLGAYLARDNPGVSAAEARDRIAHLHLEELGATSTHCAILVAHRRTAPGVAVFSRGHLAAGDAA